MRGALKATAASNYVTKASSRFTQIIYINSKIAKSLFMHYLGYCRGGLLTGCTSVFQVYVVVDFFSAAERASSTNGNLELFTKRYLTSWLVPVPVSPWRKLDTRSTAFKSIEW
jgi:hypothetical protein